MRIQTLEIRNYKGFRDSGPIEFLPGINLVVGKNNAGKSSLLEALSLSFASQPFLSEIAYPFPTSPRNLMSEVEIQIAFSGAELRPLLLNERSTYDFLWPSDANRQDALGALENILVLQELSSSCAKTASDSGQGWQITQRSGLKGYTTHDALGTSFRVQPTPDRQSFQLIGNQQQIDPKADVGLRAVQLLSARIYVFRAARRGADHCSISWSNGLAQDASNLADVLHTLSTNKFAFEEYQKLVQQVFPDLQGISVYNAPGNAQEVQVRIWLASQASKRADLAIPLSQCGTGLAQVLAILYVVVSSTLPQVIAIDEPNSFLHPDASRALIRILKNYSIHQYIITTHSAEVISECEPSRLFVLKQIDGETIVTAYGGNDVSALRDALLASGTRLSDVFGYDKVLWVEGPSDAAVFTWLTSKLRITRRDVSILPVRSTGDFEGANIDESVAIHRTLSHADALIPATVGFLFDRELRADTEIEDAMRRKDAFVRFLGKRMLENYFLGPVVVHGLLLALNPPLAILPTLNEVRSWMEEYAKIGDENDPNKPAICHGKKMLRAAVSRFSGATHEYNEVIHLPVLARLQLGADKSPLVELTKILEDVHAIATGASEQL